MLINVIVVQCIILCHSPLPLAIKKLFQNKMVYIWMLFIHWIICNPNRSRQIQISIVSVTLRQPSIQLLAPPRTCTVFLDAEVSIVTTVPVSLATCTATDCTFSWTFQLKIILMTSLVVTDCNTLVLWIKTMRHTSWSVMDVTDQHGQTDYRIHLVRWKDMYEESC